MDDTAPETRHLRCFVAAAEVGSLRGAARRLGLAQPTVSEHVRRLEEIVGFSVFDRVGRSVVLTEQGRLLLPRAQRAVRAVEVVADGIGAAVADGVGRLTVGAIPTMSPYLLPPVLSKIRRAHPACEIVVVEDLTDVLLDRLDDHSIDAAVLALPIDHPRIETITLGQERLRIIAAEPVGPLPAEGLTIGELRELPRVSLSDQHCLGDQIESFCTRRRVAGQVVCHARQLDTIFGLVRAGMGVSVVPDMALRQLTTAARRSLSICDLRRDKLRRTIALATKIGRTQSVLLERFAEALRAEVAMHDPEAQP